METTNRTVRQVNLWRVRFEVIVAVPQQRGVVGTAQQQKGVGEEYIATRGTSLDDLKPVVALRVAKDAPHATLGGIVGAEFLGRVDVDVPAEWPADHEGDPS